MDERIFLRCSTPGQTRAAWQHSTRRVKSPVDRIRAMKTRRFRSPIACVVAAAFATTVLSAQSPAQAPSMRGDGPAPTPKPFNITRSDPGLDAVVAGDATAELLAAGFGLNEGPVWVREGQSGYLLV